MDTHIERTLPRPGFKYPWVYVIQDGDEGGFVWAVYSQSSTRPSFRGAAETIDAAEVAAKRAVSR